MSAERHEFTGRWLNDGTMKGQEFSHPDANFDHTDETLPSPVKMRHATVKQGDRELKVWAPDNWSEEQIAEALESNW